MQDLQKLVDFITRTNWIVLLAGGIIALAVAPEKVTLGVMLGGLIVSVNFHLLKRTLKTMLSADTVAQRGRSVIGNVLVKYYFRFALSGIAIFLLIFKHVVDPFGLILGLSVVVASVFIATALELKRLLFKEAI